MEDSNDTDQVSDLEYLQYLGGLLSVEEDIPPLPGHATIEEYFRGDPIYQIIFSIKMPPPIQVIKLEEVYLISEIRDLVRAGYGNGRAHLELVSRRSLVQEILTDWASGEIGRNPGLSLKYAIKKRKSFFVGKDWHMLVVIGI